MTSGVHLARAAIRREAVVFSFVLELRMLADACKKFSIRLRPSLSPHPRRRSVFDAVRSTSQHGLGRVHCSQKRALLVHPCARIGEPSDAARAAESFVRPQLVLGRGTRLRGTAFSPRDAIDRHNTLRRACMALAAVRRAVREQKMRHQACLATWPCRPGLAGQHDVG